MIFSTHPLHPEVTRDLQALGTLRIASAPTPDAILPKARAPRSSSSAPRFRPRSSPAKAPAGADPPRRGSRHDPGGRGHQGRRAGGQRARRNALTVAEHVIWSAMALLRHYPQVATDFRARGWEPPAAIPMPGDETVGRNPRHPRHGQYRPRALAGMASRRLRHDSHHPYPQPTASARRAWNMPRWTTCCRAPTSSRSAAR